MLAAVPPGVVVDATLGGGGHALAILNRRPDIRLVGIDRDPAALEAAAARLDEHRHRVVLRHGRHEDIETILDELGIGPISAALFDLGVSSPQLDRPERGFSYRGEGPLDMRMDPSTGPTAADVVNQLDETQLADLLRRNSDERHGRRIAAAIVAARPITTTSQLAAVVAGAVPGAARRKTHPARRTFQALRVEVNGELDGLGGALEAAIHRLTTGGRCAVLSYHSGEDRIAKSVFRIASGQVQPPRPGLPPPPARAVARLVWNGIRTPSQAELDANHRAAAARLRAVERLRSEG